MRIIFKGFSRDIYSSVWQENTSALLDCSRVDVLLTAVPGTASSVLQRGHQSHLRAGLEPSVGKKQSVPFLILTEKKTKD